MLRAILIALFTLTSACVQAQDEDVPMLVVIGVGASDVLNVRAEPDADATLVGTLTPNASGLSVTAQSTETLDWIHIESNGLQGWVNASYLGYPTSPEPLPIRLHCSGTEPFWGLELSYSRADARFAFSEEDFSTGFSPPTSPANRANIWLRTRFDFETEFLLLEAETCSDGMSDRTYPYSVLVRLEENLLSGCCE
jgi:uncharacterized membrane protein